MALELDTIREALDKIIPGHALTDDHINALMKSADFLKGYHRATKSNNANTFKSQKLNRVYDFKETMAQPLKDMADLATNQVERELAKDVTSKILKLTKGDIKPKEAVRLLGKYSQGVTKRSKSLSKPFRQAINKVLGGYRTLLQNAVVAASSAGTAYIAMKSKQNKKQDSKSASGSTKITNNGVKL